MMLTRHFSTSVLSGLLLTFSILSLSIYGIGFANAANVTIIPSTNLAPIDSNTQIDSGLTIGFNGAYPATLSEGGICFTASTINLRQVKFNMVVAAGSPLGTFNAQLFASTGTIGTDCKPTGAALATSGNLLISSISGNTAFFVFGSYFDLQAGKTYAVSIQLVSCVTCNSNNYWSLEYVNTNLSIQDNIYYWNNPYAVGGPHSKLAYEIDGSPIVQLKNAYGSVDVINTQLVDTGPNVYTNGTIFMQVSNSFTSQIAQTYNYMVTSYGNGTLTIRFGGPAPQQVQTSGHLVTILRGSQDISYSGGDSGYGATTLLSVSYFGISHVVRDAAFIMALFTPIVLVVGLAKWSQDPFDPKRAEKMKRLYYVALTMSIGTALLFIMSTLFNV